MEELEQLLEQLQATLTPEQERRVGPGLEELRQAVAALRLAETVAEDAREAFQLGLSLYGQAREDNARATEHFERAHELLGIEQ